MSEICRALHPASINRNAKRGAAWVGPAAPRYRSSTYLALLRLSIAPVAGTTCFRAGHYQRGVTPRALSITVELRPWGGFGDC